ncbi:glycosyltransferase family 39 protein [candidate division KSB1 bacterium]|nr:glycosyltransferase family 39 protein [candidate division KSB1 bacterium]
MNKITKYMIGIIAVGMIARLALIILLPNIGDPHIMDAKAYDDIATSLVAGKGFSLYNDPTVFVAPLYPFFLSVIYGLFNHSYLVAKICNVLLAGVTIFLIFLIGREVMNEWVGLIAAGIVAIHPELIGITAFLYTEILNTLLLALFVWTLIKAIKAPDRKSSLIFFGVSGLLLGISTLTKGTTMLFPFFMIGLLLIDKELRAKWLVMIPFVALFLISLVPWTVRNYHHFKMIIPVATGGGEALWTGNYFPFNGEYRYEQTRDTIHELTKDRPWIERDSILMTEAKKNIKANPGAFVRLCFVKVYRFWIKVYENIPEGLERHGSFFIQASLFIMQFILLVLAIIGISQTLLKNLGARIIVYLLLYYTAMHALTFAVPRYRLSVVPFLFVFSAIALFNFIDKILKKRTAAKA